MDQSKSALRLRSRAPSFSLTNPEGRVYLLKDFTPAKGLVVAFLANTCPFVLHVVDAFAQFARDYMPRGIAVIAVSLSEGGVMREDHPARMAEFAERHRFEFPYLYDEKRSIARRYAAACTPDLFLFDGAQRLYYHGRFDDSRPKMPSVDAAVDPAMLAPPSGSDLRSACDALLAGQPLPERQVPSSGSPVA